MDADKTEKPCLICGRTSEHHSKIFHDFDLSPKSVNIKPIPSFIFGCEMHGWYAISEKLEHFLYNNPSQKNKERLAEIVNASFTPLSDGFSEISPIESFD